jgi:Yip1 domain
MASFGERVIGAAKLEVRTFEEVESDSTATGQAMAVVVLSSLAAGLGSYGLGGLIGMLRLTAVALIGWAIWAVLIFFIGTKLLPEPQTKSNIPEMLRAIGFASAPGLLRFVGILPFIGWFLFFLINVWVLVANIIAVRQALDYQSTARAAVVCLIGWVAYLLIFWISARPIMATG